MTSKIEQAIVKTLAYADVFDYPLTWEEICRGLIKVKIPGQKPISLRLKKLKIKKVIYEKDGYYFLRGKAYIVKERKKRKVYSERKIKTAQKIASLLKFIPTVKLIGVTGALAVNNSHEDDDIDFLIVSKGGLLWMTRFIVTLFIELMGVRRHPDNKEINNKICLNMFLDENCLSIPNKERDLFSAHEVVQMRPIWDRDDTYNKFLRANGWVREYLPNVIRIMNYESGIRNIKKIPILPFYFLEKLLKYFQLWYMKNRRTTEVISDGVIRFHPEDARDWVIKKYKGRLSNLSNVQNI